MTQRQPLPWRILYFIGFVLLQSLGSGVLSLPFLLNLQLGQLAYAILISGLTLIFMVYFIKVYQRQVHQYNPRNFGGEASMKEKIRWVILTVVVVYLFLMVVTPLLPSGSADNQKELEIMFSQQALGITLYGAVLGPIIEELVYRGIFMNYFWNQNNRKNDILAVVISGLIFGLMHEPALSLYLVVYSFIGMAFGTLYLKTRDIRCSMLAHMIYNGLSFLAMFAMLG